MAHTGTGTSADPFVITPAPTMREAFTEAELPSSGLGWIYIQFTGGTLSTGSNAVWQTTVYLTQKDTTTQSDILRPDGEGTSTGLTLSRASDTSFEATHGMAQFLILGVTSTANTFRIRPQQVGNSNGTWASLGTIFLSLGPRPWRQYDPATITAGRGINTDPYILNPAGFQNLALIAGGWYQYDCRISIYFRVTPPADGSYTVSVVFGNPANASLLFDGEAFDARSRTSPLTATGMLTAGTPENFEISTFSDLVDYPSMVLSMTAPPPPPMPPAAPGTITLSAATATGLTATVTSVSAATAYDWFYTSDGADPTTASTTEQTTAPTITLTGLPAGRIIKVAVRASNDGGDSALSAIASQLLLPGRVGTITVEQTDLNEATVTVPEVVGATGYRVELSVAALTNWGAGANTDENRQHTFTGLVAGTEYKTRGRAFNATGNGDWSEEVLFTALEQGRLETPIRPVASGITDTSVRLSVNIVQGALGYLWSWITTAGMQTRRTNVPIIILTGLPAGGELEARVTAFGNPQLFGDSRPSPLVSVQLLRPPEAPGAPIFEGVTDNSATVTVNDVEGATAYTAYWEVAENPTLQSRSLPGQTVQITGLELGDLLHVAFTASNSLGTSALGAVGQQEIREMMILTVRVQGHRVLLRWSPLSQAVGYEYRVTEKGGTEEWISTTDTDISFEGEANSEYTVQVRALASDGSVLQTTAEQAITTTDRGPDPLSYLRVVILRPTIVWLQLRRSGLRNRATYGAALLNAQGGRTREKERQGSSLMGVFIYDSLTPGETYTFEAWEVEGQVEGQASQVTVTTPLTRASAWTIARDRIFRAAAKGMGETILWDGEPVRAIVGGRDVATFTTLEGVRVPDRYGLVVDVLAYGTDSRLILPSLPETDGFEQTRLSIRGNTWRIARTIWDFESYMRLVCLNDAVGYRLRDSTGTGDLVIP